MEIIIYIIRKNEKKQRKSRQKADMIEEKNKLKEKKRKKKTGAKNNLNNYALPSQHFLRHFSIFYLLIYPFIY